MVRTWDGDGLDVDLPISVFSLHDRHDRHVLVARFWAALVWDDGWSLP